MRGIRAYRIIIFLVIYAVVPKLSYGANTKETGWQFSNKQSMLLPESQVFGKYYLVVSYQRNYPIAFSSDRFGPGIPHPCLNFRYFMSDRWYAGFSGQYKFMFDRENGQEVAIATLTQEGAFLHRIYHPLYLSLGHRLHYLNPTNKGMIPLQKYPELDIEIGVGASIGILYRHSVNKTIEFNLNRWRGTKTMRLHAIEANIAVGFVL